MKNQKGFSLIELLIVVVIIGIIAAIAIPNLLAARRSANEGSAISALRTLHGSQVTYSSTAGNGNYAADLSVLQSQNLIDSTLGNADKTSGSTATGVPKSGYLFSVGKTDFTAATGSPSKFAIESHPAFATGLTATGTRAFVVATDGVIYTGDGATAFTVTNGTVGGGANSKVMNN